MIVHKSQRAIFFDCDDTLVLWNGNRSWNRYDQSSIMIPDPYNIGKQLFVRPNQQAINYLKQQHSLESTIVVWSAGGWQWAESVVKALGLEEYVSLVMSKPDQYVDDLDCPEFMGLWVRVQKGGKLTTVDWITKKEQDIKV